MLALVGSLAVGFGVFQGLVHVAPGYEGTITTGWGGPLNHEERLLVAVALLGAVGSVAAERWRSLAVVPLLAGGIVGGWAVRAVAQQALRLPLYTETTLYNGEPIRFVLGAEPFLLVVGGVLLVSAGITSYRRGRRSGLGRRFLPSAVE